MSSDQDSSRDKELDKRLERKSSNIEALAKLLTDDVLNLIRSKAYSSEVQSLKGDPTTEGCGNYHACGDFTCKIFKSVMD